jgi:hypothetical protein
MNMADGPHREIADRQALQASLAALDTTASALAEALLMLAKTRKDITDILNPHPARSREDEMRWSCE